MSDDKKNQEVKTDQPKARKTLGREEMFDVFKTGGEAELFARPAQKKHRVETETRTGPSINHQIHDASGPTIHHQTTDTFGPSIDRRMMDSEGPSINRAEITDADTNYGFFSPHSWTPFAIGLSTFVFVLGFVFASWLAVLGVMAILASVFGLLFEYSRGNFAE
jgi:hypothetical protein